MCTIYSTGDFVSANGGKGDANLGADDVAMDNLISGRSRKLSTRTADLQSSVDLLVHVGTKNKDSALCNLGKNLHTCISKYIFQKFRIQIFDFKIFTPS